MARKLRGIRRKRKGWQTYKRVGGQFYSETWPLSTPVEEMREWLAQVDQKHGGTRTDVAGGFAATIAMYLARVKAMPTIKQRMAHLELWAHELGRDLPPLSITSEEIDIVLQGWLEGLAKGTVRKRRTALRSFFSKMYPKKLNPVKGTTNPKEPKPEAREIN